VDLNFGNTQFKLSMNLNLEQEIIGMKIHSLFNKSNFYLLITGREDIHQNKLYLIGTGWAKVQVQF
jgi:hypothetical protein